MKNCETIAALLDPWIDGALSQEEASEVRAHLAICSDCQAYVDAALAIRSAFPLVEETEVPAGFADGVMAAIRLESRKHKKTPWGKILLPMAACLALIVAVEKLPLAVNSTPDTAASVLEEPLLGSNGFSENEVDAATVAPNAPPAAPPPAAPPPAAPPPAAPRALQAAPPPAAPPPPAGNSAPGENQALLAAEEPAGDAPGITNPRVPTPTLTITAAQAGTLLDGFLGCAYESGTVSGTLYALSGQEYATLLAALPESIPQPPAPETALIQVLVIL